jgi:hypothetical protein
MKQFRTFWKENINKKSDWIEEYGAKDFDFALKVAKKKAVERNKKENKSYRVVMIAELP